MQLDVIFEEYTRLVHIFDLSTDNTMSLFSSLYAKTGAVVIAFLSSSKLCC